MPIKHAIWTVGSEPKPLAVTRLESEQLLEDMIEKDPRILSEQWFCRTRAISMDALKPMALPEPKFIRRCESAFPMFIPE